MIKPTRVYFLVILLSTVGMQREWSGLSAPCSPFRLLPSSFCAIFFGPQRAPLDFYICLAGQGKKNMEYYKGGFMDPIWGTIFTHSTGQNSVVWLFQTWVFYPLQRALKIFKIHLSIYLFISLSLHLAIYISIYVWICF